LGAGGMGKVYLSYTPGGRPVAIKVIRPDFAQDAEFRRRFAQEVQAAQRVQGLYTAPVIDADTDAREPWLATAYVPGPSLADAVQRHGPMPVDTVLLLVAGIAEALQVIHGAGIVHRDLKPGNVLLASDGPRVIDFGIARAADATSLTSSGVTIGTPSFMAPEQAAGSTVTPATDVFALGQVAAYAALGTRVSPRSVAATLLLANAWLPDPDLLRGGNPAAWSLSDEAWFYLLFPLLLALPWLRSARGRAGVAVAACAAVLAVWLCGAVIADPVVRSWALGYFPVTRTPQFLLGVAAGLAVARGWRPPVRPGAAVALVVAWHLVLVPWSRAVPDALWYSPYQASQLLSAPLFALLVVAAARADLEGRRTGLGGRWAIRLGHWSFAWYLVHEIVIRLWIGTYGRPVGLTATAGVWLLVLAASLAVSAAAYHWVEHPLERRLRKAGPRPTGPRTRGSVS
uniref:protein kinase domain-containing protein n=1 Tax=Streptomyces fradiae TaxID=1906 RepID=UPI002156623B